MLSTLAVLPAVFLVVLVAIMKRWPPNSVNRTYGYRTRRSMASQEAWDYAQPRSIELLHQWTIWMVVWTPLVMWRWGLDASVLITNGLMTVGVLLPLWYVERELKHPPFRASGTLHRFGWGFTAFIFMSTFVPIQHDRDEREAEVRGKVIDLRWHERSRDVGIQLDEDETHYYINRGLDMGMDSLAWNRAVVGRTVTLQVVDRPAGLNWFGSVGPVRGVILEGDTLYRTGSVVNP